MRSEAAVRNEWERRRERARDADELCFTCLRAPRSHCDCRYEEHVRALGIERTPLACVHCGAARNEIHAPMCALRGGARARWRPFYGT